MTSKARESSPRKGKLLFITPNYPEVCDGVGDYTYYLAYALVEEGFKVAVLTSKDPRISMDSKVEVLPVVTTWNIFCLPHILSRILAMRPDFVLLQYVSSGYARRTTAPFYLLLLALLLRLSDVRLVTTFHEVAVRLYWRNLKYVLAALAQRFIAFGLGHLSIGVITSIGAYAKWLRKYRIRGQVIPIGSNIPRFEISERERQDLRHRLTPNGERLIATFGGAGPSRRKHLIIQGVKRCQEASGQKLRLLVIGYLSNEDQEALLAEARRLHLEEALLFTGMLPAKEVFKHLSVADIFVVLISGRHPQEGGICARSGSALAGFAAGLPVLGNRGDLTDHIFCHGENVFFVDRLDEKGVGQALCDLLSENKFRASLGRNALKTWEEEFSWPIVAKRYDQFIENLGKRSGT